MNNTPCSTFPLLHTCRWLLFVLACLGAAQSQAGEDRTGTLVSRGAGAARHQLPATAVDTTVLPRTRLAVEDGDDATLPLYRIGPDTYFLYGNISTIDEDNRGFNGNAGFIVTGDGVAVIDALGTPFLGRRLIATIRSVTDESIRYLILTHNHPDHAYGASAFRDIEGIRILGHGGMADYLASATLEESVARPSMFTMPADIIPTVTWWYTRWRMKSSGSPTWLSISA
ncbi:MAG: MBL fold metallo-hydrolase [Xanthomonadaceae bacterium]|nr:MBL fold metallo-hydrolase [Xanthomonadaceae bacterium]